MKKLLLVLGASLVLTACASSADIGASRGLNSSRITQSEFEQQNRQRATEVLEAKTQAEKAKGYTDTIKSVSEAIGSGLKIIEDIRRVF